MRQPRDILAKWNLEERCFDALVVGQEGSTWAPLSCSDSLTRRLKEALADEPGAIVRVTAVWSEEKRYWDFQLTKEAA